MTVIMKHQWIFPILCVLSMGFWACSSPTSSSDPSNPTDPLGPGNSSHSTDPSHPADPSDPSNPGKPGIYYYGNGNTWGTALVSESYDNSDSDTVAIRDRGDLYRVGYHFAGWNTNPDGTGDNFEAGSTITKDGKATKLYAAWEKVFPLISAGDGFSTLITRDGKLYSSGGNGNGELGNGTTGMRWHFGPVGGDISGGGVKGVASGGDHSFAILNNGNIAGWGAGELGKLGNNTATGFFCTPIRPTYTSALSKITAVSAGRIQTAILTDNGEYWATGSRCFGALGNGNGEEQLTFKKIGDSIRSVSAGESYVMAVKNDGTLYTAGFGEHGRTGTTADTTEKLTLNTEAGGDNAMVFSGKLNHTMLLKNDGRLFAVGNNALGQLGVGNTQDQQSFKPVINSTGEVLSNVAFVALGEAHSMILENDGTLWAAGNNNDWRLGIKGDAVQDKAVKVMDKVAHVAAGYNHTLVVTEDGKLWASGSNAHGQFGGDPVKPVRYNAWIEIDISSLR
ncbi:InlB B-repeat-containing protein [Treponema primitia]|uniref:RCC1 domain-containing protein n=1 Tax=Treponema primitia TaxID=88058 RepID=UPI0002555190|nr:InlB B-repeat-containing protein [Treponema primitia]